MCVAETTNVGDPRLVVLYVIILGNCYLCISVFFFPKKPVANMGDPRLACHTGIRVDTVLPIPPPSRCLVVFLFVGGGVFCFLCMVVVDFTMSKYISPWHLSLLCSIYTLTHSQQSATGIKAAHFSPPIWCYSCRIDAVPQLHIHYGASRTAPYGHINCPADIVPSYK